MRLSAAIITKNEERQLPGLLHALASVDEVVVVDSQSTDRTVEIARQHGAKALVRPFDTYARQRNYALEHTTGDWVLSIDADERPTSRLLSEVRQRMTDTRYAAYRVGVRSTIFGRRLRFSGLQNERHVRLFRREAARWTGDVHEDLVVHGRVGSLQHGLEHYTLPDLHAFLAKMHRYTRLAASERVAAGIAPRPGARWYGATREVFRRLLVKQGLLDGPAGWAFGLLSGLSEWVLASQHARLWAARDLLTKGDA
jgi:hypothetical protein